MWSWHWRRDAEHLKSCSSHGPCKTRQHMSLSMDIQEPITFHPPKTPADLPKRTNILTPTSRMHPEPKTPSACDYVVRTNPSVGLPRPVEHRCFSKRVPFFIQKSGGTVDEVLPVQLQKTLEVDASDLSCGFDPMFGATPTGTSRRAARAAQNGTGDPSRAPMRRRWGRDA